MQKQDSFYYQTRAGAPTVTDAVAIGRSPRVLDYITYIGSVHEKKNF